VLLSVIVPTYNVEGFVTRTIASLLAQDQAVIEIIVIDDGSTDGTAQVAKELLKAGTGVRSRVITQSNAGVSAARNAGACAATGEYLLFLDGDDFVSPNLSRQVLAAVRSRASDVVCWRFDTVTTESSSDPDGVDEHDTRYEAMTGVDALTAVVISGSLAVWTASAAYRRSFLTRERLQFTEGCHSGEDREFIYKALSRAEHITFIDRVLSSYVSRPGSITRSGDLRQFDSVHAHLRAHRFLADLEDPRLDQIADAILLNNAVGGYFRHIDNCLKHSEHSNITALLADIDRQYPQLNQQMRQIMIQRVRRSRRPALGTALFLLSPSLFWRAQAIRRLWSGQPGE
jgi:glycosyltransferase involved in cell wall biosynthesis